MSNVKTVEEIYSLVNNSFKKNSYDDIEKIAYMIMIIAKERSFSSEYHWNSKKNKQEIMRDLYCHERVSDLNNPQLICVTAARILQLIAKEFGISIYFLGNVSGKLSEHSFEGFSDYEHIIPVYKVSNNHYISMDLERNLDNIKTGKKWHNFGKNSKDKNGALVELPDTYINEIMKKIGYISSENQYLDYYINSIFEQYNNDGISKKMSALMQNEGLSKCSSMLDSSADIFRFYKKIIREYICDNSRIVLPFGGKLIDINDKQRYITGVYSVEYGNERFWLWSGLQKKMVEIPKEYMESFINTCNIKIYSGNDIVDAENTLKLGSETKIKKKNYNQFIIK